MATPSKVEGAGNNSTAQNVFRVTFSEATSNSPMLKAFDDSSATTVLGRAFIGTAGNGNKPLMSAVATTDGAPVAAWKPATATAGGATINRLKGNDSYVILSAAPVSAGGNVRFNLCWELPSDIPIAPPLPPGDPSYTIDSLYAAFSLDFSYSGSIPVLTWEFNDYSEGGTEAVPFWTTMVSGFSNNDQLLPANAGSSPSNITMHKPPSGVIDIGEVWVVTKP